MYVLFFVKALTLILLFFFCQLIMAAELVDTDKTGTSEVILHGLMSLDRTLLNILYINTKEKG